MKPTSRKSQLTVWIVYRRTPDMAAHMWEVLGVYSTKEKAEAKKREVWEWRGYDPYIEAFILQ